MEQKKIFDRQAEVAQQRLQELLERAGGSPEQHAVMAEALEALSTSLEALRHARDELESRVQARTAELARANAALRAEVAERKVAEEALRASEGKFRELFNILPIGVSILDAERHIVDVNPALERILGLSREDLLAGSHVHRQYLRADGTPMPAQEFPSARAFKEWRVVQNVEIGVVKEDGETTWTSVGASPFSPPSPGVAVTTVDITEQVRARRERERLLEENHRQREFMERVLETAPVGVAVVRGPDHRYEFVNPYYQAICGAPDAPVLGRAFGEVFPAVAAKGALSMVEAVYETGQTANVREDEADVGPGREQTYWDVDCVPLKTADGDVEAVLIVVHEVTDQVMSRRAVEEMAARDEAILTSLTEGIITFDLEGNVINMNPAALRLHGFERLEEAQRRLNPQGYGGIFQVYSPPGQAGGEPMPAEEWPMARVLRGEMFAGYEACVRRTDTGASWVGSFSGGPVRDRAGDVILAVLALRDITAQKEAEAGLKAALAEKEMLMREIYHRVKSNVQALIYLMDMQAEYIADPDVQVMIRELQERARAMALVHEKLYQSRSLAQIDFGAYLHELVSNLSRALGAERPITWCVEAESVPLGVDTAIPCGLIVTELLTNALKYAFPPGGDRPRVERGETECRICVEFWADEDRFTLVVGDNGVGLPSAIDWGATKTLGLHLINILAHHQLGGQIEVDGRAGATFKITFARGERKRS